MRNQPVARFCGRCGQSLVDGVEAGGETGKPRPADPPAATGHPTPLSPPEGFAACENFRHLYYCWEAAWGGSMLSGTETIAVILFNGGFPLQEVTLMIHGEGPGGREVFAVQREVNELPRGKEVTIEVPSYELPAPASDIKVTLVSGKYASVT